MPQRGWGWPGKWESPRLRPLPLGKLQAPVGIGGSVSTPDPDHGLLQQTPHGDAVGPCEVRLQNRDGLSSRSFARPRLSHSAPTLRRHSLPPSPNSANPPAPRTCGGSAGALRRVAEPPLYLVLLRLLPPCPETQRQRGWAPPPQRRPRSARPAAPLAGRSGGARLPRVQPCDL